VAASGEAIAAMSANDVPSPLTIIPDLNSVTFRANGGNFADKFVADRHRNRDGRFRPIVPFIDMEVRAADAGLEHLDEHVVLIPYSGVGMSSEPQAAFCFAFYERFHRGVLPLYRCDLCASLNRGRQQADHPCFSHEFRARKRSVDGIEEANRKD